MTTVTQRVSTSFDDGYSGSGGQFDRITADVIMGNISAVGSNSFYRFAGLAIPNAATIQSAKLTFRANSTQSGVTVNTRIYLNAADNASSPTSNADHASKTRTTAFTAWSPTAWTINNDYDSADFTSAVQEVVNRAGWASGNAMVVLIDNNASTSGAYRSAKSYDTDTANCALLTISYLGGIHPKIVLV